MWALEWEGATVPVLGKLSVQRSVPLSEAALGLRSGAVPEMVLGGAWGMVLERPSEPWTAVATERRMEMVLGSASGGSFEQRMGLRR